MERLDKRLAATASGPGRGQGVGQGGRVQVRGARPKGPEDKVAEGTVTVDGRPIAREQGVYVMLHKPAGVVSSTQDPGSGRCWTCCPSICGGGRCFQM